MPQKTHLTCRARAIYSQGYIFCGIKHRLLRACIQCNGANFSGIGVEYVAVLPYGSIVDIGDVYLNTDLCLLLNARLNAQQAADIALKAGARIAVDVNADWDHSAPFARV